MTNNASISRSAPRVALLTVRGQSDELEGECLISGLNHGLTEKGLLVEEISLPNNEESFEEILRTYLCFYDVDLSAYDGVISTGSPGYVVRHRNHVSYLPHTIPQFPDWHDDDNTSKDQLMQQKIIRNVDIAALSRPGIKGLFCVSNEIQSCLKKYINVDSTVLCHPSTLVENKPEDNVCRTLVASLGFKHCNFGS